jgi:hypothetical protein
MTAERITAPYRKAVLRCDVKRVRGHWHFPGPQRLAGEMASRRRLLASPADELVLVGEVPLARRYDQREPEVHSD